MTDIKYLVVVVDPNETAALKTLITRLEGFFYNIDLIPLASEEAILISFINNLSTAELKVIFSELLQDIKADFMITEQKPSIKKMLVADMDCTIIEQETLDILGDYLGVGAEMASITKQAMEGKMPLCLALVKRVKLLAGLEVSVAKNVLARNTSFTSGSWQVLQTMKNFNCHCVLMTSGFSIFADVVGEKLGFHQVVSNTLGIENDIINGEISGSIIGETSKARMLSKIAEQKGINLKDVVAIGDGANDVKMIKTAGLGIAVGTKEILKNVADASIVNTNLSSLLYFQGIKNSFFK